MKIEIIGYVRAYERSWMPESDYWTFENDENCCSENVVRAIDELLSIDSKDGDKFKITIEKLN